MADPGEIRVQDEQGTVHVFPPGSTPEMISKVMNVKPPAVDKSGMGLDQRSLSESGAVPNSRIRNMTVDPTKDIHSPGQALYEGAKMGLLGGSLPAAAYLTPGAAITGAIGGTVGGVGGKAIAKAAGAGDFWQEVGGDLGGLAGAGLVGGLSNVAAAKIKTLYSMLPAELQSEVIGAASPRLSHALNILKGLEKLATPAATEQPMEVRQAASLLRGPQTVVDPAEGLGQIPVRSAPGAAGSLAESVAAPAKPISAPDYLRAANLQREALKATGNEPLDLKPNVPLKDQLPALKAQQALPKDIPEGHIPVESSAVKSFKYDAVNNEFHVHPTSGRTTYVYGDVSPNEAQAFAESDSKGKAWQLIRNNPPVAKIINGKRIAIKPTSQGDDLVQELQDSIAAVMAKKANQ